MMRQASSPEAQMLARLQQENAALRQRLAELLDDAASRAAPDRRAGRRPIMGTPGGRLQREAARPAERHPDRELPRRPAGALLSHVVHNLPQPVFAMRHGGRSICSSDRWTEFTGLPEQASLGHGWLAGLHPDDRAAAAAWDAPAPGQGFDRACRVWRRGEARYRAAQLQAICLGRRAAWHELEWLCVLTDVDDLRELREQRSALRADLQYCVRNILGAVRSIAQRSAETAHSVEDYTAHLDGRIGALARTHGMLTRTPGAAVGLEELVAEELIAQGVRGEQQVRIAGPDLRLSPRTAEALALAIHELATNAVKYGALARAAGRIEVTWRFVGDMPPRGVVLEWQEFGVAVIASEPRHEGFGTEVIERSLPYSLGGSAALQLRPGGLHCRIEFPLDGGPTASQEQDVHRLPASGKAETR